MVTLDTFYQSKEWRLLRINTIHERLNEEGFIICEYCGKPIVKSYDIIAHHKVALTPNNVNNVEISLNPDNLQLLHHVCHNYVHDKLKHKNRKVYLVYGAPCSGKTSYVNEVKRPGDLLVDIDSIWECVSGCERYVKDGRLKSNVFGLRDKLLEDIRYRRGKWENAYVIGGYPLIGERERICKSLGAEEIYIESTMEECMINLQNGMDGRKEAEWKKFIAEWFEKFS